MPSIQQLQLNAGNYSQSQRCRTRIGDLRLRKEMFRLDIKKRFWTVWAKWLNSWGRLWKLQQCSYQRSARTLAGSKSLGIMKTKFSHNLVPCFQTQLCWFLTLLYRLTGTDVYFFFFRSDWPLNQLTFSGKVDSSYNIWKRIPSAWIFYPWWIVHFTLKAHFGNRNSYVRLMHIFLCVKLDLKITKFWSDNEAMNTSCFLTQAYLWC